MTYLSPHFTLEEFRCHDPANPALPPAGSRAALKRLCVQVLEPMRRKFGRCTVVSGYRTPSWNRKQRGASGSHHLYGRHPGSPAGDVAFASGTPAMWRAEANRLLGSRGGVGTYAGVRSVHVDQRRLRSRW